MMTTFVGILALAAQWLVLAAAQAANTTCIGNGSDDSDIQNALNNGGTNAVVEICPGAVIPIYNAIDFVAAGQVVQTQGLPTGDRRALLQIAIKPGMGTALSIFQMATPSPYGPEPNSFSNTGLRNLILDGNSATPGVPGMVERASHVLCIRLTRTCRWRKCIQLQRTGCCRWRGKPVH